ncbi:hypothetical protein M9Y10_001530 [Tritrichomonas musculus]|uniref:Uncharacterized protein n=1 Tax=Tritrichomonas musculus TaxID=1915356 RepID=A0ABR2LAB8_9EUKA
MLNTSNPTSKRIFALNTFLTFSQEDDIKSHDFFMELAKNRRNTRRLIALDENLIFIKKNILSFSEIKKECQEKLLELEGIQEKLFSISSEKISLNDLILFTTSEKIEDLESKKKIFEDDIKHFNEEICNLKNSKNVENKVNNMLQQENALLKCKQTKAKVENSKTNTVHIQLNENLESHEKNYLSATTKNETLKISNSNLNISQSVYDNKIINTKEKILNLQKEYFIKKRISLKLMKDEINEKIKFTNKEQEEKLIQQITLIKSKIASSQNLNKHIESELNKIHSEFIHLISKTFDSEQQKDEMISINQFLSEISNNLKKDEVEKTDEITKLNTIISQLKKENENINSDNEKMEKTIFDYQISNNEKNEQWDQYITYLLRDVSNIKSEIDKIKIKLNKHI